MCVSCAISLPPPLPPPQTKGPPEIVIAPSDTNVLEGNTALFTCVVAFRDYPPEVSWHRNDTGELYNTSVVSIYTSLIEESGVRFLHSILELCGVEQEDEGLYFCQAAFDEDRASRAYFFVDVLEPLGTTCMCVCVCVCVCVYHISHVGGVGSRGTTGGRGRQE